MPVSDFGEGSAGGCSGDLPLEMTDLCNSGVDVRKAALAEVLGRVSVLGSEPSLGVPQGLEDQLDI